MQRLKDVKTDPVSSGASALPSMKLASPAILWRQDGRDHGGVLIHILRSRGISVPAFPAKVLGTAAWMNLCPTFTPSNPLDTQIRFGRLPWDERDPRTEIGEVNLVHGSLGSDQEMLSHFNRL